MSNFLDDLKQELIEENPENKILLDYVDGRIEQTLRQLLDNTEFVTKEDIEEILSNKLELI